ncbi:MAG: amidohydrolase [Clostridia bacterium]|nr:amidohydrolase [Clostridia bacterium]
MSFKIIDAHMHVGPAAGRMVPDQSIEQLVHVMDKLGIEKGISANVYDLAGKERYEEGLAMDAKAYELSGGRIFSFSGFGTLHPEEGVASIRAHKDDPRVVGIKLHPAGGRSRADDEKYRPVWEVAKEVDKPIMSHTWAVSTYNPNQTYATADLFEKWVREYPEVTFVFGHCGGRYHGVKDAIAIGKKYKNAYFDITGDIFMNGFVEELVENIGADRIVYGSDYTMIEQRPMMGAVLGANISTLDKEKILYHTANRIYFKKED